MRIHHPLKILAVASALALGAAYIVFQIKSRDPDRRVMASSKMRAIARHGFVYANAPATLPAPATRPSTDGATHVDLFRPATSVRLDLDAPTMSLLQHQPLIRDSSVYPPPFPLPPSHGSFPNFGSTMPSSKSTSSVVSPSQIRWVVQEEFRQPGEQK
jgi:hypothetical protein